MWTSFQRLVHTYVLFQAGTWKQGKPLAEAKTEIMYGASYLEWYGQEARRVNGEIIPANAHGRQLLHYKEPIGVAALITPVSCSWKNLLQKLCVFEDS